MREAVLAVRISDPLLREASLQANRDGVSVEEWLLALAADRIRDEQVASRFFSRGNPAQDGRTMMEILDSVQDGPVMHGDELPDAPGHSITR